MIFAQMEYADEYSSFHFELEHFLRRRFSDVQSGIQGDSWLWVLDGGDKVSIDTFYSMKHQVKSAFSGPHVQRVLEALQSKYKAHVYSTPELEPHEDA